MRLVAVLRRRRHATAQELSALLGVSERTVYRDVAALAEQGVDIRGEAGVGYRLERGAELPPVQLDWDEVQALVFGARLAQRYGDATIGSAARSAVDKLFGVLPEAQRAWVDKTPLFTPMLHVDDQRVSNLTLLRQAIHRTCRVRCGYVDGSGVHTERTILPIGLWCWTDAWTLGAWCLLRNDYRPFRVDRLQGVHLLHQPVPGDEVHTVQTLLAALRRE